MLAWFEYTSDLFVNIFLMFNAYFLPHDYYLNSSRAKRFSGLRSKLSFLKAILSKKLPMKSLAVNQLTNLTPPSPTASMIQISSALQPNLRTNAT